MAPSAVRMFFKLDFKQALGERWGCLKWTCGVIRAYRATTLMMVARINTIQIIQRRLFISI